MNKRDPLNCESIQRVNGRGGGGCVKEKEMINGLLGLLTNRREEAARNLVFFFIFKPNRFSLVRFGLAGSGTPKPETEPNRTFS